MEKLLLKEYFKSSKSNGIIVVSLVFAIATITCFNLSIDSSSNNVINTISNRNLFDFKLVVGNLDSQVLEDAIGDINNDDIPNCFSAIWKAHRIETFFSIIINKTINWTHVNQTGYNLSLFEAHTNLVGFSSNFYGQGYLNRLINLSIDKIQHGEVILPREFLLERNLSINDTVQIGYSDYNLISGQRVTIEFGNFTIKDSYYIKDNLDMFDYLSQSSQKLHIASNSEPQEVADLFFFNYDEIKVFSSNLLVNASKQSPFFCYTKVNKNLYSINSFESARDILGKIEDRINIKLQSIDFGFSDYIINVLDQIESQMYLYRLFSVVMTIPLLFSSYLFSTNSARIQAKDKVREISILQARGIPNKILKQRRNITCLLNGAIGSFFGLGSGFCIFFLIKWAWIPAEPFVITPFSIFFPLLLGFVFIEIATFFSYTKYFVNKNTINQRIKYYLPPLTEERKVGGRTIALYLITGVCAPLSGYLFSNNVLTSSSSILDIIFFGLQPIFVALSTVSNIFLTIGLIYLVIYYIAPSLINFLHTKLHHKKMDWKILISHNLKHNLVKYRALILLMSFSLSFCYYSIIVSDNTEAAKKIYLENLVGGDIKLNTTPAIEAYNSSFATELLQKSYIEDVLEFKYITAEFSSYFMEASPVLINFTHALIFGAFDTSISAPDRDTFLNSLNTCENGLIILEEYAREYSIELGDVINIRFYGLASPTQFTVIGMTRSIPGISWNLYPDFGNFILPFEYYYAINASIYENFSINIYGYLLNLKAGYDIDTIYQNLRNQYRNFKIQSIQDPLLLFDYPGVLSQAILLMRIEYFIMLIIVGIGISFIINNIFKNREKEFFTIKARGYSNKVILKIMVGEFLFVFLISALIAMVSGFFNAATMFKKVSEILNPFLSAPLYYQINFSPFLTTIVIFVIYLSTIMLFGLKRNKISLRKLFKQKKNIDENERIKT